MPPKRKAATHSLKLFGTPQSAVPVKFLSSDGIAPTRSFKTTPYRKRSGAWDYYKPISPAEQAYRDWTHRLGNYLSALEGQDANTVFESFPADYMFYWHITGTKPRYEPYLVGSASGAVFRTVPEFVLHARWLQQMQQGTCLCKYCAGGSQADASKRIATILDTMQMAIEENEQKPADTSDPWDLVDKIPSKVDRDPDAVEQAATHVLLDVKVKTEG
ncbi:hypothetical protein PENSPDRAFT_685803 [Peniophora sp. CONT]|nr:hypothetical protein PENSPDRAFT_685803 [Peniophora sp. CONT]